MFRNYLITALRNFTRHKLYSFLTVRFFPEKLCPILCHTRLEIDPAEVV